MKTIAVEEHFKNGEMQPVSFYSPDVNKRMHDLGADRLADMERAGIDMQVLQYAGVAIQSMDAADGSVAARDSNDFLAELVKAHPDHYAGLVQLALKDPDGSAKELERGVTKLGLKGAVWSGTLNGVFLDDSRFEPVLAAAEQLDVPIYIHPGLLSAEAKKVSFSGLPEKTVQVLSMAAWGWHAEVAVSSIRLVAAGIFDRHPNLKIVIGHLGEFLPVALARIDRWMTPETTEMKQSAAEYFHNNFALAVSGYFDPVAFQCAKAAFGMDSIMFGVDYPFVSNMEGRRFLDTIELGQTDMEKLTHINAERIFKL